MNHSVASTVVVGIVKPSWITSPEIFVWPNAYSASSPARVSTRSPGVCRSTSVRYVPRANDAPKRRPVTGVTPAPASNVPAETGFVATPATDTRTGAELATPTRASHRLVDNVTTPASGYVEDTADTA